MEKYCVREKQTILGGLVGYATLFVLALFANLFAFQIDAALNKNK